MPIHAMDIYNTINSASQKLGKYIFEENTKGPKFKTTKNVLSFLFVVFLVKYRLFVLASIKKSFRSLNVKKTRVVGLIFFCMISAPVFVVYQPKLENLKNGKHTQAAFQNLAKPNVAGLEVSSQNLERFIENFDDSLIPKRIGVLLNNMDQELWPFCWGWNPYMEAFGPEIVDNLDSLSTRVQARRLFLDCVVKLCMQNSFDADMDDAADKSVLLCLDNKEKETSFGWLPFIRKFDRELISVSFKELVDIYDYYLTKYDPLLSDYDNLCWNTKDAEYLVDCINANGLHLVSGQDAVDSLYVRPFEPYPRVDPAFAELSYAKYEDAAEHAVQEVLLEMRIENLLQDYRENLFVGNARFLEFENSFLLYISNTNLTYEGLRTLFLTALRGFLEERVVKGFVVFSRGLFRDPKYRLSVDECIQVADYYLTKFDPLFLVSNDYLNTADVDLLAAKLGFALSFPQPVISRPVTAEAARERSLHLRESYLFHEQYRKEIKQVIKAEKSFCRENPGYDDDFTWFSSGSDSGSGEVEMGVEDLPGEKTTGFSSFSHSNVEEIAPPYSPGLNDDGIDIRLKSNLTDDTSPLPLPLTTMLYSKWRGKDAQATHPFFSNPVDPELDNLISEVDNFSPHLNEGYEGYEGDEKDEEDENEGLSAEEESLETKPSSTPTRLEADNVFGFFEKNPVFFGITSPMRIGDNFLLGTPNQVQENSLSFLYRSSVCETELDINSILEWYIDLGQKSELLYSNIDWMAEWILLFPQRQRPLFKRFIERNLLPLDNGETKKLAPKEIEKAVHWLKISVERIEWARFLLPERRYWENLDWVEDEGWQLDWAENYDHDGGDSPWHQQHTLWPWYNDNLFNFYTGELGTLKNFSLGEFFWENTFETFKLFDTVSLNNEMSFDWETGREGYKEEVLFDWYEPGKKTLPGYCLGVLLCFTSDPITISPFLVDKRDYNALITDDIIGSLFPGLDLYRCSSFLPTGKREYEERHPVQQAFTGKRKENYQNFFDIEELPLTIGIQAYYFEGVKGPAFVSKEKNIVDWFNAWQDQSHQQLMVFPKRVPSVVFSNLYNFCQFLFPKALVASIKTVLEKSTGFLTVVLPKEQLSNFFPTALTGLKKEEQPELFYYLTPESLYKEKDFFYKSSFKNGTATSFTDDSPAPERSHNQSSLYPFSLHVDKRKESLLFSEYEREDLKDVEEGSFRLPFDLDEKGGGERKVFSRSSFTLVEEQRVSSDKNLKAPFQSGRYILTPRYSNTSNKGSWLKRFKIFNKLFYIIYLIETKPKKPKEMRIFESFYRFIDDNDLLLPIRWKRPFCKNYHSPNFFNDDFKLQYRLESGYSPYYETRALELRLPISEMYAALNLDGTPYPIRYLHKVRVFISKYNWYNYYLEKVKESRNTFFYNLSTILKSISLGKKNQYIDSQISQMEKINIYNHYSEDLRHASQGYNPKKSIYREMKLSDFKEIFFDSFLRSKEPQKSNPLFKRVRRGGRHKRERIRTPHKNFTRNPVYTYIQRERKGLPVPLLREVRGSRPNSDQRGERLECKAEPFDDCCLQLQRNPRKLQRYRPYRHRRTKSWGQLTEQQKSLWRFSKYIRQYMTRFREKYPVAGISVLRSSLVKRMTSPYKLTTKKGRDYTNTKNLVVFEHFLERVGRERFLGSESNQPLKTLWSKNGVEPNFKLLKEKLTLSTDIQRQRAAPIEREIHAQTLGLSNRKGTKRVREVDQQFVRFGFPNHFLRKQKTKGKETIEEKREEKEKYTPKKVLIKDSKDSKESEESKSGKKKNKAIDTFSFGYVIIKRFIVGTFNIFRYTIKRYKLLLRNSHYYRHQLVLKDQTLHLLSAPKRLLPLLLLSLSIKLLVILIFVRPVLLLLLKLIKFLVRFSQKFYRLFFIKTAEVRRKKLPHTSLLTKNSPIRLKDLGGFDKFLPELCDIVYNLQISAFNRKMVRTYGFRKGFLFVGPPGTGKTVLVKALAGQAKVPVVVESVGSLLYVNHNNLYTKQNRIPLIETFKRAKRLAPCILFIDEIDTIGTERKGVMKTTQEGLWKHLFFKTSLRLKSKDKKRKTIRATNTFAISKRIRENKSDPTNIKSRKDKFLNQRAFIVLLQLLVELDKLSEKDAVFVIGATNRPEVLDPALIRPGRLSNIINLQPPKRGKRIEILKLHSSIERTNVGKPNQSQRALYLERALLSLVMFFKNKKWEKTNQKAFNEITEEITVGSPDFSSSSWEYFAHITQGFSASDLAAVVQRSYLQAILQNTNHTIKTFEEGIDYVTTYNSRKKKETHLAPFAYYQAGKAVIHTLLPLHPDVSLIKAFSRRKNFRSRRNITYLNNIRSRPNIETRLIGLYAGKAAELLFFSLNYMSISTPKSLQSLQSLQKIQSLRQPSFFSDKKMLPKKLRSGDFSDNTSDKRQAKIDLFYQNNKPYFQSFLCQTSIGIEDLAAACHITGHIVERGFYSNNIGAKLKAKILTTRNASHYREIDLFRQFINESREVNDPFCDDADLFDSRRFRFVLWRQLRGYKRWLWGNQIEDRFFEETAIGKRWFTIYLVEPELSPAEMKSKKSLRVTENYFHDYLLLDVRNYDRVKGLDSCAERIPRIPKRLDHIKKGEERGSLLKRRDTRPKRFTNCRETKRDNQGFSQRERKGRLNLLPKNDDHQPVFSPVSWHELYQIDTDYISHTLIYSSFNQAFCLLDENREVLDYLVDYLLRFEVVRQEKINEILFAFGLPDTTYKNETESETKNKQTTYVSLKQKFEVLTKKRYEKDQNKEKRNSVFAQNWGKDSRRGFSRFFTFNQ